MSLHDQLKELHKESKFLSHKILEDCITAPKLLQYLRSLKPPPTLANNFETSLAKWLPGAKKFVAVMILSNLALHIPPCVGENLSDAEVFQIRDMCPEMDLRKVKTLDDAEEKRLLKGSERWAVSPILDGNNHVELPQGTILPFTAKEKKGYGSWGTVYRVEIAKGHFKSPFHPESKAPNAPNEFALKEVQGVKEIQLKPQRREAISFYNRRYTWHDNLVPLLASFEMRQTGSSYLEKTIFMLFPYAERGDMEAWLQQTEIPTGLDARDNQGRREYLYNMTKDLISALACLHREVEGQVMCHHDLKPSNILVFGRSLDTPRLGICDLGMSRTIHPVNEGRSEVNVPVGFGTRTYQPPEYFEKDTLNRNPCQLFGRPFDMWAMGCIMIQIAILIAWGWESGKVKAFKNEREKYISNLPDSYAKQFESSFFKSMDVVDDWVSKMQALGPDDPGRRGMLSDYLAVAIQMLREDPSDRICSWEAELDLHEMLHPEESYKKLEDKTIELVQKPSPGKKDQRFESPLHRAATKGNLIRSIELIKAGWPVSHEDKEGRTPSQLAELNGHEYLRDVFLKAEQVSELGREITSKELPDRIPIHIREGAGLKLRGNSGAERTHTTTLRGVGELGRDGLHVAAMQGDAASLNFHLSKRSVVDTIQALLEQDGEGKTPLHYAATTTPDCVTAILEVAKSKGLSMRLLEAVDNRSRRIPLHEAAEEGKLDIVEAMLRACPNWKDAVRIAYEEDVDGDSPKTLLQNTEDEGRKQAAAALLRKFHMRGLYADLKPIPVRSWPPP